MKISIGNYDCTELWDGVLYKALSDYPDISDNEMKDILDFIVYEKRHGRAAEIAADRPELLDAVRQKAEAPERYRSVPRPPVIRECTACKARGGCMTDLVCHTAPPANAENILRCGSLLSAVRARGLPAEVLMREERNAAHDPCDFFHYVMFTWGNCQAGDRLVMERKLGRSPAAEEMGRGFTPGVRFYFRYAALEKHPDAVHDGFLPIKVKNEVILSDYVHAVIIPQVYRELLSPLIPEKLIGRTYFLDHSGLDVWQWSEKAYAFVSAIGIS